MHGFFTSSRENMPFNHANLFRSNFAYTNAKFASFAYANLSKVNFIVTNLHEADLAGTIITDKQLGSVRSIRGVRLPNGTLGQDPNLLKNWHADCNSSLVDSW